MSSAATGAGPERSATTAHHVRDLPIGDRPVVLVWAKRLWRCPEPDCPVVTWSEDIDEIAPRAALTERARAEVCRLVGECARLVAEVARAFGVSWHTAMAAVRDHGRPRVDHLSRLGAPAALGVDETAFLAATPWHPTLLVTGFIDLDRYRLIDVVEGRTAAGVRDWLATSACAVAHRDLDGDARSLRRLRQRDGRRSAPCRPGDRSLPRHPPNQRGAR